MFNNIREDLKMWTPQNQYINPLKKFLYLLFTQEFHAVLIYRFGRWAYFENKIPILGTVFKLPAWAVPRRSMDRRRSRP